MSKYILSILGIVLISVLVELILPSGETSKYVKSILSVFVIYVLVTPLVKFFNGGFDVSKYLSDNDIKLNSELLEKLYSGQVEARATGIEERLTSEGFLNVKITFESEIVENELIFKKAKINLDKLVITRDELNINKYQYIRQVVMSSVKISEEDIIFE